MGCTRSQAVDCCGSLVVGSPEWQPEDNCHGAAEEEGGSSGYVLHSGYMLLVKRCDDQNIVEFVVGSGDNTKAYHRLKRGFYFPAISLASSREWCSLPPK